MEANINRVYRDNKAAKVGADIICPVCGKIFQKRQYSQAFCSGACKDAFHNAQGDRHNAPRKLDGGNRTRLQLRPGKRTIKAGKPCLAE